MRTYDFSPLFRSTIGFDRLTNIMGANLSNGLLNVELVREIPEELKPRKIEISNGPKTRIIKAA